jgi:PAS domain-containing protein
MASQIHTPGRDLPPAPFRAAAADGAGRVATPRRRQSRYRKLPALNRMMEALLAPRSLREGLTRLARTALASFSADGAYIQATVGGTTSQAAVGNVRAEASPLEPPKGAHAAPALEGRLREIALSQGFPPETRSYLAAHFAVRGLVQGFLALGSLRAKAFRPSERPELAAFARLGALAVAHARVRDGRREGGRVAPEGPTEGSGGLLEAVLESLGTGVAVTDQEERLLFLNQAARRIFGDMTRGGVPPWLAVLATDEHGVRITPERWPARRVLLAGEAEPIRARIEVGGMPQLFEVSARAIPVAGARGPQLCVVTEFRDL